MAPALRITQTQGLGQLFAVVTGYRPIHQTIFSSLLSVHVVVVNFDAVFGNTAIEKMQQAGNGIFTTTHRNDVAVITQYINGLLVSP